MANDVFFRLENVTKRFGDFVAVDNATVELRRGEVFSLLGPSGCGKTTLLRIAAGFQQPDQGRVILDGEDITSLPPNRRQINTVFQNYALFPHLTVYENIAFGLRVARKPAAFIRREVERMIDLVDLEDHASKKPAVLSGGQKQRVAIARALVNEPRLLLLDEPLAALDLKLRQRMLLELDRIHDEVGISFVYVTHDQGEAMSLSDRIAVMNKGMIQQTGSPAEIYEAPKTSFVAAFIGDTNFLVGRVEELLADDYCRIDIEGLGPDVVCYNDDRLTPGQPVNLSVRPEKFRLFRERPPSDDPNLNFVHGRVENVIYLGSETKYWVQVEEYRIAIVQQHTRFLLDEKPITWDDPVWVGWHGNDGFMLQRYEEGDEALLAVPPDSLGEAAS